jgi:hypothetical protein
MLPSINKKSYWKDPFINHFPAWGRVGDGKMVIFFPLVPEAWPCDCFGDEV